MGVLKQCVGIRVLCEALIRVVLYQGGGVLVVDCVYKSVAVLASPSPTLAL